MQNDLDQHLALAAAILRIKCILKHKESIRSKLFITKKCIFDLKALY